MQVFQKEPGRGCPSLDASHCVTQSPKRHKRHGMAARRVAKWLFDVEAVGTIRWLAEAVALRHSCHCLLQTKRYPPPCRFQQNPSTLKSLGEILAKSLTWTDFLKMTRGGGNVSFARHGNSGAACIDNDADSALSFGNVHALLVDQEFTSWPHNRPE